MEIAQELCHRLLQEQYQYIIAIHTDHDHIHAHILVNNTNFITGRNFETEHNQGRKSDRAWAEIRRISDELCKEYNLSVIEQPKNKGVSHYEWEAQKNGTSWKEKLRQMIKAIAEQSADLSDFFSRCTECGIEYVYTPQNKVKLKFRLKEQGQQRFTRADTLGEEYTPERLVDQIAERKKMRSAAHTVAEVKAPTPPKPTIPPKTPKTEYVYQQPSDDDFYRAFGVHLADLDEPKAPAPKPTESQAPEKKEDVWAAIRGMRDSDKMIADLEAGGITSLDDLRSFFWNIHHDDDHTDEIAELKAKIKPIDKLIKMMKQRSKHSAVYKQYQECSVFSKKRFRKKNAAAIDEYEEADKYITEHIKDYLVDGKAPKRSELEQRLIKLKSEYNVLVPEHNAFLKRQAAASQYTRQVRNYLQSKEQQERDRQYQERKRTQQKKKDTIE